MKLKNYCQKLHNTKKSFTFIYQIRKDKKENEIIEATNFLNDNRISARVYCILHNITKQPKCYCGEDLKFNQYSEGFRDFCSTKCSANSSLKQNKIKETNLKKYGCVNTFQSEEGRKGWNDFQNDKKRVNKAIEKCKKTMKENYGVDTVEEAQELRLATARKAKLDKYGSIGYNNREKSQLSRDEKKMVEAMEKTCMVKYGVRNAMQDTIIFDKYLKNAFKLKDYIFPSGKVVKVQGFEPITLDRLLLIYKEDEIKTETKDKPKIFYIGEDNKKHRYIPDIFIPKDNLIIEVKSDYTMETNLYVNLLKGNACKKEGYNFKYEVYGNKGKPLI